MTFGHLRALWLLLVIPVLVLAYALDGQRGRRLLERLGHPPMIKRMVASASIGRRRLQVTLLIASIGLLALALGRPQIPGRAKLVETRGLDLIAVLDFSKSMLARDVYPSRLERAKSELRHLIDGLRGDRVGVVAFAGETLQYPLTLDYEAVKLFWRDLTPEDMPVGGSDLGRAIRTATDLLVRVREREGRRRPAQVIVLFTDGEETEGKSLDAARDAGRLGIRVYALGIGSAQRSLVPVTGGVAHAHENAGGYLTDSAGELVRVGVDEAALQKIAMATNGEYQRLDPQHFGAERVQHAIGELERTEEATRLQREPEDVGYWLFAPAFFLLLVSGCIGERRRPTTRRQITAQNIRAAALMLGFFPCLTGFDLFMRRDPDLEEGNRLLSAGKAEEALQAYDRAAAAHPGQLIAHFDRGNALFALRHFFDAQKEFQKALDSHDQGLRADAYYNLGNALFRQERWKEAFDAYKQTLLLRSGDLRARWNIELAARKLLEQSRLQQRERPPASDAARDSFPETNRNQGGATGPRVGADLNRKPRQEPAEVHVDRQAAEALLDALERAEPALQRDLARRRAGSRSTNRDW
jgi:Ca-activated chloride channel family protein